MSERTVPVFAVHGNIENEGIEFAINANPVHTTDFSWDFNFNVTYNKRVITNLNKVPDPTFPGILVGGIAGGVGNTIQIHTVGYAPNAYYVYKQVYNEKGQPLEGVYADLNGDGKITAEDRYRYKGADPKVYLGFSSQFSLNKLTCYINVSCSRAINIGWLQSS